MKIIEFNYKTRISNPRSSDQDLELFNKIISNPEVGFFQLTEKLIHLENAKKIYSQFRTKKNFVQIGIGGSALGPQMLVQALQKNSTRFFYIDNIDSEEIEITLNQIQPKDTLFYVVSKSGSTAETMAGFIIAQNWLLKNGVSSENLKDYLVFCTDPNEGELRQFLNENQFANLALEKNIGGRFSVLSCVGLLPALFAGLNIDDLYNGANEFKQQLLNNDLKNNPLVQTANIVLELMNEFKINQTVLMPYSSRLKFLSSWFVQLWAESLGKKKSQNEFVGLTPVPAYGATDQHSQVQLFMEGPKDKLMFMLEVGNRSTDFSLSNKIKMKSAEKLAPFSLNQLMWAEFHGTLKALQENDRDFIHLKIKENNEFSLGALIIFFESLTALVGIKMNINPFNQPGVELGKKYAFEWLNSIAKNPK